MGFQEGLIWVRWKWSHVPFPGRSLFSSLKENSANFLLESRGIPRLFLQRGEMFLQFLAAVRRKNGRECEWDAKKIRKESLSELREDGEKTFFSFLPPQPYLALTEDALFIKPKKLSFPLKRHKKARRAVHCAELVNVLGSRKSHGRRSLLLSHPFSTLQLV